MPSLEERLFHCLRNNLYYKDEIIQRYGKLFDYTRYLSLKQDFSSEFADVLNKYHGGSKLKENDFSGYIPMHVENNYAPFGQKHGIMSFLFGIVLSEKKWKKLLKKLDWQKWAGGMFVPAGHFRKCANTSLNYQTFGFALGSGYGVYEHEALHACRQLYSRNCFLIDGYGNEINYGFDELRARCEYTFIDEMCAYVGTGWGMAHMVKTLKTKYWNSEIKTICSLVNNKWPASIIKKKTLKNAVRPVLRGLVSTIESCFYLKQRLSPDILTPLFYSLGPTINEIMGKEFCSVFADIRLWAELLEKDVVRPNLIMSELRNKGYCMNSISVPVP
ncbi:MAG: hypothetical protein V1734_00835 [Nanoarchaeota archaeon]